MTPEFYTSLTFRRLKPRNASLKGMGIKRLEAYPTLFNLSVVFNAMLIWRCSAQLIIELWIVAMTTSITVGFLVEIFAERVRQIDSGLIRQTDHHE